MSTVWFHFLLMENKEVMVCTFPGTGFLGLNTIGNYRFIKRCWEKKEKKALQVEITSVTMRTTCCLQTTVIFTS